MPNWERRETDTLAEAIGKYRKRCPGNTSRDELLSQIQQAADAASSTVRTSEGELMVLRSALCSVCRASKLYACDVPTGWSSNCAFVYANTTAFGSL